MTSPTGFNPNHKVAEGAHSGAAAAAAAKPAGKPEVELVNAKIQKKSLEEGVLRAEPKKGETTAKLSEKKAKNIMSPESRQELRETMIKSGFSGEDLEDYFQRTVKLYERMDPDGVETFEELQKLEESD